MADKPINDILIVAGNNMNDSLENFHGFNIVEDPQIINEAVLYKVKAWDVPVRREAGWYFWNQIKGAPNIVGKLDLNKERKVIVKENLVLRLKEGKPSIYLAFPNDFEKLPNDIKAHKIFGRLFDIGYKIMANAEAQEEVMRSAEMQESEINDRTTQSINKVMAQMTDTYQKFQDAMNAGGKPETKKKKDDDKSIFDEEPGF